MGVYIRNIDIPEIKRGVAAIINIDDIMFFKSADDIVLIPDHGDLIDRDAIHFRTMDYWDLRDAIDNASVVIPAERSEE